MSYTPTVSYLCWVETTWSDTGISLTDYTVTMPRSTMEQCWSNDMLTGVLMAELEETVLADDTPDDHGETPVEHCLAAWMPLGVASIGTLYPCFGPAYSWWQTEITLRRDEVAAGRLANPIPSVV